MKNPMSGWGQWVNIAGVALAMTTGLKAEERRLRAPEVEEFKAAASIADIPLEPGMDVEGGEASRYLYDNQGRRLHARLMGLAGESVTVERVPDGRRFTVPLNSLSAGSKREIREWSERNVGAIKFAFDIEARKRMVASDTYETTGRTLKTAKWVYDVALVNLTRNDLKDAELEFRVVYDDAIGFSRTSPVPGKGESRDGEAVTLPLMAYNARAEFSTPPIELHTYRYEPSRGESEFRRDKLVGIWIRLKRNGEVIEEFKSNEVALKDAEWDGEEGDVIRIKDSFADQFQKTEEALLAR